MGMGFEAVKADHPAPPQRSFSKLLLKGCPLEKGSQTRLPPRKKQVLTVDVLDEAGGAGHIVHFELSQGCTGRPRGRPVARRRDADGTRRSPAPQTPLVAGSASGYPTHFRYRPSIH